MRWSLVSLFFLGGCTLLRGAEGTVGGDCADGADNDADGAFDCDDDGCDGSPDCDDDACDGSPECDGNGGNQPPTSPVLTIEPAAPARGDALVCRVVTDATDPDGDAITYRYEWTRDGVDADLDAAQVPEGVTGTGEAWTCLVTPNDGARDGLAGSASVTIGPVEAGALDILLVMDNSASMQEEAERLARSLDTLPARLAEVGATDWRIGVTTMSVYYDDGQTIGIDPGEGGTLVGGTVFADLSEAREALLCNATCWDRNMPSDPSYACGDPLGAYVSEEYLDCACGEGAWQGNCGTGTEQGLEAGFLALCRGVAAPPDACYTFPDGAAIAFSAGDEGSNRGLRDEATTLVLVVTDEGDSSPRTSDPDGSAVAGEVETVATTYATLFDAFPSAVRFSAFGPAWDGTDGGCLDGAQGWGVERYQGAAALTGGAYAALTDPEADCELRDVDLLWQAVFAAMWN